MIKLPVTLAERDGDKSICRTLGETVDVVERVDVFKW